MIPSYTINAVNALVLIIAGFISYTIIPSTAMLAAPVLGILLLVFTYHLRRHNRFVLHTITALTLLAGIYFIMMFEPELFSWQNEHLALLVMGISCFIATLFYVGTFVRERRQRDNTLYKEDL